jgi:hypothetical protein
MYQYKDDKAERDYRVRQGFLQKKQGDGNNDCTKYHWIVSVKLPFTFTIGTIHDCHVSCRMAVSPGLSVGLPRALLGLSWQ